jgi:hypothetical protein
VGLSLNFMSQALSAFAAVGLLRSLDAGIRIVLGGGLVTSWLKGPLEGNPFTGPGRPGSSIWQGCAAHTRPGSPTTTRSEVSPTSPRASCCRLPPPPGAAGAGAPSARSAPSETGMRASRPGRSPPGSTTCAGATRHRWSTSRTTP